MTRSSPARRLSPVAVAAAGAGTVAASAWGHPMLAVALAATPLCALVLMTAPSILLTVMMFEMALGGWGHAIDVGPLSLRQILAAGVLGVWGLRRVLTGDTAWPVNAASLTVALALAVMSSALLVSLALGHSAALQDGLTPAFLLLFFVFSDVCRSSEGRAWLLRTFVWSIVALAVLQIALNAAVFGGTVEPHSFSRRLDGLAVFTIVSPRFARIFLVGSVLFPVALCLLGARWLAGVPLLGRRLDALAAASIGVGLVLTFTRGFWLVTVLAVLMLWLLTTRAGRVRWIVGGTLLALAGAILAATQPETAGLFANRILALMAGGGDASVAYRLELYPRLLQHIGERPFFGYGVGYPIDGLLYVENSYFYYALKVGLVGAALVLASWLWLLISGVRLARRGVTAGDRATGAGFAAATTALLVLTAINPFINSPVGMYFEALGLALTTASLRPVVTPEAFRPPA